MNPNIDPNKTIAKILGWSSFADAEQVIWWIPPVFKEAWRFLSIEEWRRHRMVNLPDWFGHSEHALDLCQSMLKLNFESRIRLCRDELWRCDFVFRGNELDRPEHTFRGESLALPEAISEAFLRAHKMWEEKTP